MKVSMLKCKKRLAILWFSGSTFVFLLFFFQTILGHYGEKISDAWSWLLPNLIPTLSLIIGVLSLDAFNKPKNEKVDNFFYRLSYSLSLVYLILINLSILLQPLTSLTSFELFKQANLWLGPFQGLVNASIGAFFVKSSRI